MKNIKRLLVLSVFVLLGTCSNAFARLDLIKTTSVLNKDYTFIQNIEVVSTVLNLADIPQLQVASQEFFPSSQKLEVVEAYIIHADGEKILVPPANITKELSAIAGAAPADAPNFSDSHTMKILFPQLKIGSRTYFSWKITQIKPFPVGYNNMWTPPFYEGVKDFQIKITLPKTLPLFWRERGGFKVKDIIKDDTRTIDAHLKDAPPHVYQNSMANPLDFSPIFLVSAFSSWDDLAAKLYKATKKNDHLTSKVQNLSNRIVENKKGKAAAEAIYNWVAQNIQYVAVYLNMQQELIAHTPEEILENGYGDCKDHSTLMQALLKAQGIESFIVFVNWGNQYKILPWPEASQFDHAMIYLPDFNIFANPTNPFATFGILGEGLDGKFVIIQTPEGKTAHLPSIKPQDNTYKNTSIIEILPDGTVKGSNTLMSTGSMDAIMRFALTDYFSEISSLSAHAWNLLSQEVNGGYGNFTFSSSPYDLSHPFIARGTWTSPHSFSMGEDTAYIWVPIGLDLMNPHALRAQISPRKRLYPFVSVYFPGSDSALQFIYASQCIWSYEIKIPENYMIAHRPSNISFKTSEGSYKSTYTQKGDKLFVERILTINKSYFSIKDYDELRPLLYKLEKDVNEILMLKKRRIS